MSPQLGHGTPNGLGPPAFLGRPWRNWEGPETVLSTQYRRLLTLSGRMRGQDQPGPAEGTALSPCPPSTRGGGAIREALGLGAGHGGPRVVAQPPEGRSWAGGGGPGIPVQRPGGLDPAWGRCHPLPGGTRPQGEGNGAGGRELREEPGVKVIRAAFGGSPRVAPLPLEPRQGAQGAPTGVLPHAPTGRYRGSHCPPPSPGVPFPAPSGSHCPASLGPLPSTQGLPLSSTPRVPSPAPTGSHCTPGPAPPQCARRPPALSLSPALILSLSLSPALSPALALTLYPPALPALPTPLPNAGLMLSIP
ncbi:MAPK-interacting and spindle-stabilizing protein-like [Haliaeetus albicilla]|uniref:MAPK-interacting and spindle-stabilizing protein-like n=1 Tax=Haliaeetus albicilla TaxID=8969 RepID=UPI0037E9C908